MEEVNSKGFWRKPLDLDRIEIKRGKVFIDEELCKGCGFCIEFCPGGVLEKQDKLNSKGYHPPYTKYAEKCTGCGFCERVCPEFAIVVEKTSEKEVVK